MAKSLKLLQENIRHYAPDKTNYWISKETGVSEATLSALMNNNRNPTLDVVEKLADGLGVAVSDLLANPKKRNIPADILDMLDGQDDDVYETVRTILLAIKKAKLQREIG